MIRVLTDNRNRTVAEIRHILDRHNGSLGEAGCVSWQFEHRGVVAVDVSGLDEDMLIEAALEAGADDVEVEGATAEVITAPGELMDVKEALEGKGLAVQSAETTMRPKTTVPLAGKQARSILNLMEALEEQDDVQNVYANFDIPEEELTAIADKAG